MRAGMAGGDGTQAAERLCTHAADVVEAVAVGTLPDGPHVVVSGGSDGKVQIRRLTDGTSRISPRRRAVASPHTAPAGFPPYA
jgi:hypothetical protein